MMEKLLGKSEGGLRWYHRGFLSLAFALVVFGTASVAASQEAQASHLDDWYAMDDEGTVWCYYTYTDAWYQWGCGTYILVDNSQYYWFYQDYNANWWVLTSNGYVSYRDFVSSRNNYNNMLAGALSSDTQYLLNRQLQIALSF